MEECDSLDFPSSGDMWFSASDSIFSCEGEDHSLNSALQEALFETGGGGEGGGQGSPVSFFATFMKVRWGKVLRYMLRYITSVLR